MKISAVVLLLAALGSGVLQAQDARWDEANRKYQAADYAGALEEYQQILKDGREAAGLYYNIGNAQFKLGHLGPAILAWERALRLSPGDDDVRANLALARSLTQDDITPQPRFWLFQVVSWWVGLLPAGALRLVVAIAYALTAAGVVAIVTRIGSPWMTWIRRGVVATAVVTLVFGINLLVRELGIGRERAAIILAREVMVQSAPSDDPALQVFTIHEGTKVRIDQVSSPWLEVALEDGKVGWVKQDVLAPIAPAAPAIGHDTP